MLSLDNSCPHAQVAKGFPQTCPHAQVYWVLQIATLENTHRISCVSL